MIPIIHLFFSILPTRPDSLELRCMGEDKSLEIARLRTSLHRIQQICALHRRMGEDTECEVRELRRKIDDIRTRLAQFSRHYELLLTKLSSCDVGEVRDLRELLDLCTAALRGVEGLMSSIN